MGFLMTTESQDLSLTSHPKDSLFTEMEKTWTAKQVQKKKSLTK